MERIHQKTTKIAIMGVLLALVIVLVIFENMLPPLPGLPPGVRLGLSNVVIMYTLLALSKKEAGLLLCLKSLFVFLSRGGTAGLFSIAGGLVAVFVMILLLLVLRQKISYLLLSVAGAIAHNLGQIALAALMLGTNVIFGYLPILVLSGTIMGIITGTLLRVSLPLFSNILTIKVNPRL